MLAEAVSTSTSNQHFQILLIVIAAGLAGIGWFVRRSINNSDRRYERLVTAMSETNKKLGQVAEGLANVVGQLSANTHNHHYHSEEENHDL